MVGLCDGMLLLLAQSARQGVLWQDSFRERKKSVFNEIIVPKVADWEQREKESFSPAKIPLRHCQTVCLSRLVSAF